MKVNNDEIIDLLLADPNYKVTESEVLIKKTKYGQTSDNWRLAGNEQKGGYRRVQYTFRGKRYSLQAHRIIYRANIGPLDPLLVVNHKDHNCANNHFSNLELVTHSINNLHGNLKRKPQYGNAKITFKIAESIREDRKVGFKYSQLIEKYGLSKGHISDIVNNKIWVHKSYTIDTKIKRLETRIKKDKLQLEYLKSLKESE